MNKIKKIASSILVGILAIIGVNSVSNAYYVGQELTVHYSDYASSSNIFCMEYGQALTYDNDYKIISQVTIEGTKSTDYENKIINHKDNAKFAYILSADNGNVKDYGPVAKEIWDFGPNWMKNVGQYHNGLYLGFSGSAPGINSSNLAIEAEQYANSIVNGATAKDNTDKNKIKVEAYTKDNKQYMRVGPFNWTFGGTLTDISIYDQDGKSISGKLYSTFNGNTEKWIKAEEIKTGSDFYISVPVDSGVTKITKVTGKGKLDVKGVKIWFLEAKNGYKQNLLIREPYGTKEDINISFDYNIPCLGNLKVIKVNKDNKTIKLSNVGFNIQNKDTKKWVKQDSNRTISYVDSRDQATEFITDKNGEITIKNLVVGTYVAWETKNLNYGYEILKDGQEKQVVVDKTAELEIPNEQKFIKLSGYVWVDREKGKQQDRNDLYKDDSNYDVNDILLDGITVRLKNKSGETIKETKTSNGGAYQFVDVLVADLDKYYIEFEYDGLTYTNVKPHIDRNNGSKAAENATTRDDFNKGFSIVTNGDKSNTGVSLDENKNKKNELTYNVSYNSDDGAKSKLINNGKYLITANTDETKYTNGNGLKDHFTYGQEEIKFINLGLYEREQPDISLVKDLQNVNIAINGYNNVYNYAQRFKEQISPTEDDLNVGVKYKNQYTGSYSRAVYGADYKYKTSENNKNGELKVYITYQLKICNESSSLTTQVNDIVDYYDSGYTVKKVGATIYENGDISDEIEYEKPEKYNDKYNKIVIHNNTKVEGKKQSSIYVQFELNREAVERILNNGETLDNVAEIASYSIFDKDGKVYAGIDKDSNPGNAVPGDKTTYEDDTDSSPALQLEVADAREMSGKVFLDSTTNELKVGEIRQGSGAYEEGEQGIEGVEITLEGKADGVTEYLLNGEVTKSEQVNTVKYTATTDGDGDFLIKDFIPGDYTLTYTWGNETYSVQNYKGTIYDSTRDQSDKEWYKKDVDTRLTDAIDDYETRSEIDSQTNNIENGTTIDENTKMNSTTPTMAIGVELDPTAGNPTAGNKYVYQIRNIDFGIVERARQNLTLDKRVKTFKATLANGQVIVDLTINEDGTITGERDYITYMGPIQNTNGFIKLELDNELIQGTTIEVGYEIKATNKSELDYVSEDYYKYGIEKGNKVTLTPSAIVDYLDKDWGFEQTKNTDWDIKQLEDIKNMVDAKVYGDNSDIANRTILYTEKLKDKKLEPNSSATVELNVSKVLANSDEISLDNETEITKIEKSGGSTPTPIPGNYVPGTGMTEDDDSTAETVIVTPSTGDNKAFIIPTIIGVAALIILGVGVVLIKKKTLGDKE